MPNTLKLLGRPSILRLEAPELSAALVRDTTGPAKDDAIAQANDATARIQINLDIADAVGLRIRLWPPIPQPQTLQDLVRAGRLKLADLRQQGQRGYLTPRLTAVSTLVTALKAPQ